MHQIYQTKVSQFSGSDFHEVHEKAFAVYSKLKKKSKRRPYVRSVYFNKEKIFLDLFWHHLFEKKNWRDRVRRMKYYPCAIELIQNSRFEPYSKENPNRHSEILHRFVGSTRNGRLYHVQIKENKKTGRKYLISVYPVDT